MSDLATLQEAVALPMWNLDAQETGLETSPVLVTAPNTNRARKSWFALGVTARHEKAVSEMLDQKGYETFLPLYKRRHYYERRFRDFHLPVFPGYVFCRFDPLTRLPIVTTPGVNHVVGAGRIPVPLDEQEIASLQMACKAGVPMKQVPFWQSGQKGRITEGPLAGIEGIVVTIKQSVRIVLSVTLLQRSVLLEIDADCVRLA